MSTSSSAALRALGPAVPVLTRFTGVEVHEAEADTEADHLVQAEDMVEEDRQVVQQDHQEDEVLDQEDQALIKNLHTKVEKETTGEDSLLK